MRMPMFQYSSVSPAFTVCATRCLASRISARTSVRSGFADEARTALGLAWTLRATAAFFFALIVWLWPA